MSFMVQNTDVSLAVQLFESNSCIASRSDHNRLYLYLFSNFCVCASTQHLSHFICTLSCLFFIFIYSLPFLFRVTHFMLNRMEKRKPEMNSSGNLCFIHMSVSQTISVRCDTIQWIALITMLRMRKETPEWNNKMRGREKRIKKTHELKLVWQCDRYTRYIYCHLIANMCMINGKVST